MILARPAAAAAGLLSLAPRQSSSEVSQLWRVPDALQSDFDQWYVQGEQVNLFWTGGYNDSFSDLWITGFDDSNNFAQLLTRDVDLTLDGSFTWTVSVPAAEVDALSSQFRLRFKPNSDNAYDPASDQLASPGFLITAAASGASNSSDTTAANGTAYLSNGMSISTDGTCGSGVSCQSSGFGTCCGRSGTCGITLDYCGSGCQSAFGMCNPNSGGNSAADSGAQPAQPAPGLPVGAQAGIGLGVVGAVMALAGLGFFLLSRHKKRQNKRPSLALQTNFGPGPGPMGGFGGGAAMPAMMEMTPVYKTPVSSVATLSAHDMYYGHSGRPQEVDGGDDSQRYQYGHSAPVELDGGGQTPAPVRIQEMI